MDIRDATCGKIVLVATTTVFAIASLWVNSYPFIDEDSAVFAAVPDPQWFLLFCACWGFLFVGGLMCFTFHHIRPFL